jgi:prevent-host-death family protein
MTKVNIHEAKTNLSKLLEKAMNGEEVVIAKAGEPMVRLVPVKKETEKDWFGMDEGKIWIADDFDELPDDIMAAFYGESENENID